MPPKDVPVSLEQIIVQLRDSLKLEFSHHNDNIFAKLDIFFTLSLQQEKQIINLTTENVRLQELLTEHKIDFSPPKLESPDEKK